MDGITIYYIAKELASRLVGARIDKVQQPERDEVILTLRCPGENLNLLLSSSAGCGRVHLTNVKKTSPLEPAALCMLMRKHLIGGRLTAVRQVDADRMLAFDIEHIDELGDRAKKTLLCELMGKHSNIILLGGDGRVIECARHINETVSSFRDVLPGVPYTPPPAHGKINFDSLDANALRERLSGKSGSLAKLIQANISGLSLPLAREAAYRAAGDEDAHADDAGAFAGAICTAVNAMLESPSPAVIAGDKGEMQELEAFEYLSRSGERRTLYPTLSEAADDFYRLRDQAERIHQKSASIARLLKTNTERLERKLVLQQEAYDDAANSSEYRIKGEMLMANPHLVKKGMKNVELPNYYDEGGAMLSVPLDEKLDAQGNAQRYFKLYKKAQVARKLAAEQLENGRAELEYLEGQAENLKLCTDESSLNELRQELIKSGYIREIGSRRQQKALPASQPMRFTAPDGTVILAGRNNVQNEKLTFGAEPDEIWLHAKNVPGCHVIIKSSAPSPETLLFAAGIAARYSKAGTSSYVEVDAVPRRFVKKPSGARPGFVTYTHQRTLNVKPIEG
ncbi:MAG: NFACT family protein [Clostridia bacterium]|nr:NFACT family protein [Clostridia bacterium]